MYDGSIDIWRRDDLALLHLFEHLIAGLVILSFVVVFDQDGEDVTCTYSMLNVGLI
jgi:hypothetical protein